MVLTRSQARARGQHPIVEPLASPTRRSRKRTSSTTTIVATSTPKAKAKTQKVTATKRKGKGKTKVKPHRAPSEPAQNSPSPPPSGPVTPERFTTRPWPQTPRAPRKSNAPALKPDFPSHLAFSPYGSTSAGTPLVGSDIDFEMDLPLDFEDDGMPTPVASASASTPTPTATPQVRSVGGSHSSLPTSDVPTEVGTVYSSSDDIRRAKYLSPRDIVAGIPGNWIREPGETCYRLINIPDEEVDEQARQDEFNQTFMANYDRLMIDRDNKRRAEGRRRGANS